MVSYSGAGASCGTRRDEREVRTDRSYANVHVSFFFPSFVLITTDSKKQWTRKPESILCFLSILYATVTIKPEFSIFKVTGSKIKRLESHFELLMRLTSSTCTALKLEFFLFF